MTDYDETQAIGRRYRRQDEIGTPLCVTVDFDSLDDNAVTVRDRDSMEQTAFLSINFCRELSTRLGIFALADGDLSRPHPGGSSGGGRRIASLRRLFEAATATSPAARGSPRRLAKVDPEVDGIAVISEVKRRSPSKGDLFEGISTRRCSCAQLCRWRCDLPFGAHR